jgi:hypothetical protein
MMAFANSEDPWIDYLIISWLGGCYTTPIIYFFQDGRFGIKIIDPQRRSSLQHLLARTGQAGVGDRSDRSLENTAVVQSYMRINLS